MEANRDYAEGSAFSVRMAMRPGCQAGHRMMEFTLEAKGMINT